ncbi:peptidylprolyl isomerase [Marinimicrobium sp. ABcell2]|uniref:peptidylprolyl isomerase n=1 Tax=Marinimicrobium sp. ABcell2 TaxID=3069751 RepID=UPI0027AEB199|nr:peptidylprolyl isomerase [Marinimicrobium sp. ABcell2]MDQ2078005.1 peptidylprolyl isomerase [Marinimicrobium sp. ABcell2]
MITLHTNMGDITLELNHEKAPKTAANFKQYAEDGFFDGTIFHRVISNFMIQGGGFTEDMQQKETRDPIENEADNGLNNAVGSVAMARTNDPHSASSQFFINVQDNGFLNHSNKTPQGWGYCVFAKVTDGMDVVNKIKNVKTGSKGGHQDVPVEPVVIERVTVNE